MRFGSEQMDQYMALSKKDLQINITLNELYNTQSLLIQHLDVLVRAVLSLSFLPARLCTRRLTSPPACSLARQAPNDKQHLRILLEELGPAPAQVPRKENRAVELPLYSRWEMPIQDITTALMAENNVTQNDILYLEAKSIFVQLIRSLPRLAERRPIQLPVVAETAATAKDATLVRKGIKVKEMLRELEELRLVDRRDGYKLLTDEVAAELAHLGNLREKVVVETKSLDSVYKTICDHNAYLRSQLEQYKAYLQNVRQTSATGKKGQSGGVGVVTVAGKDATGKGKANANMGPFKFTHQQFEKDAIIIETNVPENRCAAPLSPSLTVSRAGSLSLLVQATKHLLPRVLAVAGSLPHRAALVRSPSFFPPYPWICSADLALRGMSSKGREKAILEMDLKIDDLLEKKNQGVEQLDMEYGASRLFLLLSRPVREAPVTKADGLIDRAVSLNVSKVLALLNKCVPRPAPPSAPPVLTPLAHLQDLPAPQVDAPSPLAAVVSLPPPP